MSSKSGPYDIDGRFVLVDVSVWCRFNFKDNLVIDPVHVHVAVVVVQVAPTRAGVVVQYAYESITGWVATISFKCGKQSIIQSVNERMNE